MDSRRFDDLTRALATGKSRRHLLKLISKGTAAGLLAFVMPRSPREAPPASPASPSATSTSARPTITNGPFVTTATLTAATITWSTDQPTDSSVAYGPSWPQLDRTVSEHTLVTEHTLVIPGLPPGATYHFRVHSRNVRGMEASTTTDRVFMTLTSPITFEPVDQEASAASVVSTDHVPASVQLQQHLVDLGFVNNGRTKTFAVRLGDGLIQTVAVTPYRVAQITTQSAVLVTRAKPTGETRAYAAIYEGKTLQHALEPSATGSSGPIQQVVPSHVNGASAVSASSSAYWDTVTCYGCGLLCYLEVQLTCQLASHVVCAPLDLVPGWELIDELGVCEKPVEALCGLQDESCTPEYCRTKGFCLPAKCGDTTSTVKNCGLCGLDCTLI